MTPFLNGAGLLVSGCVLAGCIAGATESEFGKAVVAQCEIVTGTGPGGQEVSGRLTSPVPVEGSYEMTIIASDARGNLTTVRQGGGFAAAAQKPVSLGTAFVQADEAAASMVVTLSEGGILTCEG